MPTRYLEINYLDEYITKKNSILNQFLLTVPYLDYGKEKIFTGIVEQMKQLAEINCDGNESIVDENSLENDFGTLKNQPHDVTQNMEKFEEEKPKRSLSMIEIIPSSNPDSPMPDSFDDLMLSEFEKEVEEYVVKSITEFEDDQMPLEIHDDRDDHFLLEELESEIKMENLQNPFSAAELSKKLKPAKLSDPFEEKYQVQAKVLQSDRLLSNTQNGESESEIKKEKDYEEDIQKIPLDNGEENLLEESLVELAINKIETETDLLLTNLNELNKMDVQLSDRQELSVLDVNTKLPVSSIEQFETSKEEKGSDQEKETNLAMLIDIEKENEDVKFESPVSNRMNFIENDIMLPYRSIFQNMESQEISPLHERQFVSPLTRLKYEESSREYDKYLDDTLAMSLKVPRVELQELKTALMNTIEIVDLKKQDTNCKLEVDLAWDPLQNNINMIKNSKKELSNEIRICENNMKHQPIKDPIIIDVKKVSLNIINAEFVKEDFQVYTRSNTQHITKEINQPNDLLKRQENETKKQFISNLEKLEKNIIKKEEHQKAASSTIMPSHQTSTPVKSEPKMALQSLKPNSVAKSPLDHFVLLRTGEKTSMKTFNTKPPIAMVPPRNHVKAAKVKLSVFKSDQKSEKQIQSIVQDIKQKTPQSKENNEEIQHPCPKREIVTLQLTDDFVRILRKLEKDSRPLLSFLKGKEILSAEYSFFTLNPDVTRFLLRQQERKYESSEINNEAEDIMKGIVCLHALILAADAVSNYGIIIAIGVLKSIREKYQHIINGILDPVRKQLAKEQYKLHNASKFHPKIQKISSMIENVLEKPDRKVIILVRRYFECCYSMVQSSLHCMKNVVVKKYPKELAEEGFVNNLISQANVIVAELSNELQFCPWNRFSFVFEFEFKEESEWYNVCFEGNHNLQGFFALACFMPKDVNLQDNQNCKSMNPSSSNAERSLQCFSQHIIIGSTMITGNKQLLCELENKFNITIIERDYSSVYRNLETLKYHYQPDITIDERTCIMLFNHDDVKAMYINFEDQITSALLKCTKCFVIACCYVETMNQSFPHDFAEKISNIILRNSNCKKKDDKINLNVLYAFSYDETAQHILNICNDARDTSQVWTRDEWGKRFWLTEEMSMHEQFLLSFPYFTSFSAQVALTATSLKSLLGFTLHEMKMALKWIPEKLIEAFHASINHGLFEEASSYYPGSESHPDEIRRKSDECLSDGRLYTTDNMSPSYPHRLISSGNNENGYFSNAKTEIPKEEFFQPESKLIYNKERNRHENQSKTFNDEQNQMSIDGEIDDYDPYNTERMFYEDNNSFDIEKRDFFMKDFSESKIKIHPNEYNALRSNNHGRSPEQGNSPFTDFNQLDLGAEAYEKELMSSHFGQSSGHISQHNVQYNRKDFPKWKLTANDRTTGMQNSQSKSCRNAKEKLIFTGIPKSVVKGRESEVSTPTLTQSNRNDVLNTPSTVRLKPSKRRRLTYERDPWSKNGQTRLAFI